MKYHGEQLPSFGARPLFDRSPMAAAVRCYGGGKSSQTQSTANIGVSDEGIVQTGSGSLTVARDNATLFNLGMLNVGGDIISNSGAAEVAGVAQSAFSAIVELGRTESGQLETTLSTVSDSATDGATTQSKAVYVIGLGLLVLGGLYVAKK